MSPCGVKFGQRLAFTISWLRGVHNGQVSSTLNFFKAAVAEQEDARRCGGSDCDHPCLTSGSSWPSVRQGRDLLLNTSQQQSSFWNGWPECSVSPVGLHEDRSVQKASMNGCRKPTCENTCAKKILF